MLYKWTYKDKLQVLLQKWTSDIKISNYTSKTEKKLNRKIITIIYASETNTRNNYAL